LNYLYAQNKFQTILFVYPNLNFSDRQFSDRVSSVTTGLGSDFAEHLTERGDLVLADALPVDLSRLFLAGLKSYNL
jgi:hypothetical protein